ncbi:hypothetical protein N656DRAFT_833798 [Canariomyces notabilis]|uniref:Aminoglycoside phosphotransferase domain-containing protein n=1 Tax=Canariomyces notabilis TaxID=2074819 RepID=A0AAN6TN23_9PEZI|nr:hypothetical protein N656DRAFT_833798 [Canariomyces arenarius]
MPDQSQCDQIARSISGASNVYNVDTPGSMSYTVGTVVSFREPQAHLDQSMVELAQAIHGPLVPKVSQHGPVDGADPPLAIHTMPYLPGISCLDALDCQVDMDDVTEAKHVCFVRHLARYFARCWFKPQHVAAEVRAENLNRIQSRFALLKASPSILSTPVVSELAPRLPALFAQEYPQVLTHGDLSRTNILVDEDTFEITGIIDWSLAAILPFGMELDTLYLTTGYMNLDDGDYDDGRRAKIRDMAEQAARIGAILRYAFQRNADGSPSETLVDDGAVTLRYLQAWLAT